MAGSPIAILQIQLTRSGASDEHPFARPVLNIGRAADNDVILEDPQVSGHHLRIEVAGVPGQATVTDLGSTNGVKLNGQRIPPNVPTPLRFGDVIELIEFRMTLRPFAPGGAPAPWRGSWTVAEQVRLAVKPQPGIAAFVAGKLLKFPLTKPTMTLGRAPDNDIVLDHPQVSRHHAQILQASVGDLRQAGTFVITDLGSANGLTFNGQRVPQRQLADGDTLFIGGTDVAVQFRSSIGFLAAAAPAPGAAPSPAAAPAPSAGKTAFLNLKGMEAISIGRAKDNRIILDHPQISRHHALIERMGTRYRIKDLKSSNGVFVGGRRIEKEAWLKEGDEIRIGGVRLILREDGIQQFTEEGLRLDVTRLNKWVSREKNLLQDISLCIYPQEFVALVGMSGSGKSTLMDAINGFRPATHGNVTVNSVDLYRNFDLFRNEMGYVPQKDIVHQELTVYSALSYAAQLRMPPDTSAEERHKRITEVLHDLDLTERKDLPIHKLSGGQLKRVSIGVELLTKPRLFFLDEPTSGLDPGTEYEMMKLLRKLADQGRTIILITHATKNVMMCDKVIFLARGGHMAYYGSPEEALPYFDQYRTQQERQVKDIEFDDIYMILNDEKRGSGKDWGERYRKSKQYRENVVERLEAHKLGAGAPGAPAAMPHMPRKRPQAGTLRQFIILSARNLKIMLQDKFGLALMLALAPLIGLMDFIWGTKLFDLQEGDASKIITMLFMAGLISILVGAMASVREIVKEVDIYKRERAVNLKLTSYIFSKIWVGISLSAYQAVVLLFFLYVFVLRTSPLNVVDYVLLLITMFLGTLSGYLMGLCISAIAPNQNVALLLVVVVLVPQFLFAGALLPLSTFPGGYVISSVASTRWAFEAMVNISGIGKDVAGDRCWQYVRDEKKQPSDVTEEQKQDWDCKCMGGRLYDECRFPGVQNKNFYDPETRRVLAEGKPYEPPEPVKPPEPQRPAKPTELPPNPSQQQQQQYQKDMQDYQKKMDDYQKQMDAWKAQVEAQTDAYKKEMDDYKARSEKWQTASVKVSNVENGLIKTINDNFGLSFQGSVITRWFAMSVIMLVVLVLVIVFQKQKDTV